MLDLKLNDKDEIKTALSNMFMFGKMSVDGVECKYDGKSIEHGGLTIISKQISHLIEQYEDIVEFITDMKNEFDDFKKSKDDNNTEKCKTREKSNCKCIGKKCVCGSSIKDDTEILEQINQIEKNIKSLINDVYNLEKNKVDNLEECEKIKKTVWYRGNKPYIDNQLLNDFIFPYGVDILERLKNIERYIGGLSKEILILEKTKKEVSEEIKTCEKSNKYFQNEQTQFEKEEIEKCKNDIVYFVEQYLTIDSKPIILHDYQKECLKQYQAQEKINNSIKENITPHLNKEEYIKCKNDIVYFTENHLTLDGEKITLKDSQKNNLKRYYDLIEKHDIITLANGGCWASYDGNFELACLMKFYHTLICDTRYSLDCFTNYDYKKVKNEIFHIYDNLKVDNNLHNYVKINDIKDLKRCITIKNMF